MGCPLSKFSDLYDAHAKAHEYGRYFQIPSAPHVQVFAIDPNYVRDMEAGPKYDYGDKLLNRKFKIAFSAVHRDEQTGEITYDNCVELRTNDMGIAPIVEDEKVVGYQVYVGGGQGEKNGKPTFATLGVPLGVFSEENLMHGLKSIVDVHKEWGDRKNRHWARLKYVVHKQGVEWYREQVREKGGVFELPKPGFDPGPRMMHHGWTTLPTTGKLAYGAYIENGRLVDSDPDAVQDSRSGIVTGNGQLKAMVPAALQAFPGTEVMITANQDLLFVNIDPDAKETFEAKLAEFGYGKRKGKAYSTLRVLSGSCVGLPTCRLSYTDSEQFEPELIDELEEKGFGEVHESIGITGCERQCFRPGTKSIGWVGQGPDMYALKLGGSEDGRHQGTWVVVDDQWHLRRVPREDVSKVTAALFEWHHANRDNGEDFGAFTRRMGNAAAVAHLRSRSELEHLFEKSFPAPFIPPAQAV
ncbi:MAG: nitrite/sulfite reductase [Firmicutes bacterium]|nr:nitrite/sulfite reductase [Bacillota bacterium]